MSSWSEQFTKPYRHRHIWLVIKLAVVLHIFLSSRDVQAILYYLFKDKVSPKTICQWTKKFPLGLPEEKVVYGPEEDVILFADEKYVWIKKVKAYWWTVRDHTGRILASLITTERDGASAEKLFRRAKARIIGQVHAVVRDGLKSYTKPIKKTFGRRCKSIVRGIKPKWAMVNYRAHYLSNNISESINAQIDAYYTRLHYNFNNLESANQFVTMFLYRRHLREGCT